MPAKTVKKSRTKQQVLPQALPLEKKQKLFGKSFFPVILIGLLAIALLYFGRGLFLSAIVNNQPVFRLSIIQELEKQAGKQTLNSLVTKTLILQEANKKHVSVSNAEVDSEYNKIAKQVEQSGQKLEDLLAAQGRKPEDLKDQIKTQKLVEKLLAGSVKVTDAEIDAYIDKNKDSFPQGAAPEARQKVKDQLTQQKLSESFQTWIADLQKKSHVIYFVNY